MNLLDLAFIIILGSCFIRSIFKGLVKEWFSLIGIFTGFILASLFHLETTMLLTKWISNAPHLNIFSFLIIFFGIYMFISIVGNILSRVLNIDFPNLVNRSVGAGFGTIEGILIISVLLLIFTAFFTKDAPAISGSFLVPYVAPISERMAAVASRDIKHNFFTKIKGYKKDWNSYSELFCNDYYSFCQTELNTKGVPNVQQARYTPRPSKNI